MGSWESSLSYLAAFYVALGLFVWVSNLKDFTRLLAFGMTASIALWTGCLYMTTLGGSDESIANWGRCSFIGIALLFPAMGFVVRSMETRQSGHLTNWALAPAVFLSGLLGAGAFHPEVIRGASFSYGSASFQYGKLYPVELVGLGILGFITFFECARISGRLSDHNRVRAEILLGGMALAGLLTTIPTLLLPLIGYPDGYLLGPYTFLPGALAAGYAVAGRKVFDPEVALGPLFNTRRYRLHVRVREAVMNPDAELTLPSVFESLQQAFSSRDFSLALLDDQGQPKAVVGKTDLPLPSPEIIGYQNGTIVGAAELPDPLRQEMRKKRLAAVVRLGSSTKPVGVLSLGESFEGVLFSRQDFALLKMIARQIEMIVRIAKLHPLSASPTAADLAPAQKAGEPGGWFQTPVGRRVLIFDPSARLRRMADDLEAAGMETKLAKTADQYAGLVRSERYDLGMVHPGEAGAPETLIERLRNLQPSMPLIVVTGTPSPTVGAPRPAWPEQVLGVHDLASTDGPTLTRIVESSIAASRYIRGLVDSGLLEKYPEAGENLFPLLLTSLSEAKDYPALVRLFQKRLIEHHLRRSKTNVEAAKALGLSPPNLSLKLKFLGITYRPFLDPAHTALKRRDEN